jgi:hypothetical protein
VTKRIIYPPWLSSSNELVRETLPKHLGEDEEERNDCDIVRILQSLKIEEDVSEILLAQICVR